MAAFAVVVTVSAAKARNGVSSAHSAQSGAAITASGGAEPVQVAGHGSPSQPAGGSAAGSAADQSAARARMDQQLAAALRSKLSAGPGPLSVGIIDVTTGAEALYNSARRFPAAGIETADILAALLLQHQRQGVPLAAPVASLATEMMRNGGSAATGALWRLAGDGMGVGRANQTLKLAHTSPGQSGHWEQTGTTVADQLQLLADFSSPRSPLLTAERVFAAGLLADVAAGQRWGVPAAASSGTSYAVCDGWMPDPRLWVVNSIGIVRRGGQELLIAVLSSGNLTEAGGVSRAAAAAIAAARVITRGGS
jgi:hypothetical protein